MKKKTLPQLAAALLVAGFSLSATNAVAGDSDICSNLATACVNHGGSTCSIYVSVCGSKDDKEGLSKYLST